MCATKKPQGFRVRQRRGDTSCAREQQCVHRALECERAEFRSSRSRIRTSDRNCLVFWPKIAQRVATGLAMAIMIATFRLAA